MASRKGPSVIFIDEVDSLVTSRNEYDSETARRIKTEFLVRMQGVTDNAKDVVVLAATNVPWELDPAMRRRFELRIYIPLPDCMTRIRILKLCVSQTANSLSEEDFEEIAYATDLYSGADLSCMTRNALMEPIRDLQNATHFKRIDSEHGYKYIPCEPNDPDAIKCGLYDLSPDNIDTPVATKEHFTKSIRHWRPSISRQDVTKHELFMNEHGKSFN